MRQELGVYLTIILVCNVLPPLVVGPRELEYLSPLYGRGAGIDLPSRLYTAEEVVLKIAIRLCIAKEQGKKIVFRLCTAESCSKKEERIGNPERCLQWRCFFVLRRTKWSTAYAS